MSLARRWVQLLMSCMLKLMDQVFEIGFLVLKKGLFYSC